MKISSAKQEKLHKTNKEISIRIQFMINAYKETTNKLAEFETITKNLTNKEIEEQPKYVISKQGKNDKNRLIARAILFDIYRRDKTKIVTKNKRIKAYPIIIQWDYSRYYYCILYRQKWQLLKEVVKDIRREGVIYGTRNIIQHSKKIEMPQ